MDEIVNCILKRRSIRAYSNKIVPEELIKKILECGIYAPTAKNRQKWHFTVITNKERIEEINKLTIEGMEKIGIEVDPNHHIFHHAPVVVILSSKLGGYSRVNAGCAVENMSIAAESLNLGSCIIGQTRYMYHDADKNDIDRLLKIPENYDHDVSICFGYPSGDRPDAKPRKEDVIDYIL
ncbi:MAG: nitroreductase family protein [Tenericutes bacterium]|nr:nitroreductase family protein [Mycoplasmatota bacterium]